MINFSREKYCRPIVYGGFNGLRVEFNKILYISFIFDIESLM